MTPIQRQILDIINECIVMGKPCPSNLDICERLDVGGESTVADSLARLKRDGIIETRRVALGRVVRIVATGKETPSPRTRKAIHQLGDTIDLDNAVRVDRDPCGYCGVRGDIGCRHRWRDAA